MYKIAMDSGILLKFIRIILMHIALCFMELYRSHEIVNGKERR